MYSKLNLRKIVLIKFFEIPTGSRSFTLIENQFFANISQVMLFRQVRYGYKSIQNIIFNIFCIKKVSRFRPEVPLLLLSNSDFLQICRKLCILYKFIKSTKVFIPGFAIFFVYMKFQNSDRKQHFYSQRGALF